MLTATEEAVDRAKILSPDVPSDQLYLLLIIMIIMRIIIMILIV